MCVLLGYLLYRLLNFNEHRHDFFLQHLHGFARTVFGVNVYDIGTIRFKHFNDCRFFAGL